MQNDLNKLATKLTSLRRQLESIRNSLDMNRIIGINKDKILDADLSSNVFGHIQQLTLSNVAIGFSKMFEFLSRNETDSLPRIIGSIPKIQLNQNREKALLAFGARYGNHNELLDTKEFLRETLKTFKESQSDTLKTIREFRDKIGAHAESGITNFKLPCHSEFELILIFCIEFYHLISTDFHKEITNTIERKVGVPFLNTLEKLGVESPYFDFDDPKA